MKTPPSSPEFERFTAAVSQIVRVSPSEMQTQTAVKKQSGKRLSKGASSLSPAASEAIRSAIGR